MQDRGWHNAGLLCFAAIAALVPLLVSNNIVKYIMICFMTAGMYTTILLILNWTSETLSQPERKRSVAIALVNSFGHTSFIYGSYLWPRSEAPWNMKGWAMSTGVLWFGVRAAALMPVIFHYLPKNEIPCHIQDEETLVMEDERLKK